ncbi:Cysteine-rich receptor-like protein kinase 24 [Cardamine amara subsp. amara]|uniref:Cysteine-rich receptor-like protein kinase 24 n=1 Tax=Cardamine amara subsp. amara TaxID=228776 RepID=A0ABD0ZHV3_CARAN
MVNFSIVFLFVLISSCSVSAQICLNRSGFFTANGTYDLNRRLMLSSLPSNVTANDGFYTTWIGQDPNRAYGLGMCVPGTDAKSCSDCIVSSSDRLLKNCTNQIEAIDWRMATTLCHVRYSNRSFYGLLGMEILRSEHYTRDFQDNLTDLEITWEALMIGVIDQASSLYYAAGTKKLESSSSTNVYSFVQCSKDISLQNCTKCLQQNVIEYRSCCRGRQGGVIARPSCFIRWEIYPFLGLFDNPSPRIKGGKRVSTGTIVAIVVVPILLLALGFYLCKKREAYKSFTTENGYFSVAKRFRETFGTAALENATDDIANSGSLQFEFKTIEAATSHFHNINKLGHGGFGEVYKGTFPNGAEVAVKRLSKTSGQGEEEFKNEVFLVAKLQHRNLVRLLGFSVKGEEKILVYEFLHNKSLDHFLFDPVKKVQLDWTRRYNIIEGITRGILYLHQDSRLTIIHRDLKASNILLDADMNPKISDFGMARNFRVDQTEDTTGRVVGTFGYMPPEYVTNGQFSTKSDVYSFGVLILEIIGGKRNSSFNDIDGSISNLVTYVWRLWNNESLLELVDAAIGENYDRNEVIRCIHIGLLCVQENPVDRPTMSTVFHMLTNTSITLPVPQPPGFVFRVRSDPNPLAERLQPYFSTNMSFACHVSITCPR